MTILQSQTKQKRLFFSKKPWKLLPLICMMACIFMILQNAEACAKYVEEGLILSATAVIPSLFPFMVLSELIVSSGAVRRLPRSLLLPLRRLLHISDAAAFAALLGLLCGFPVGARCAATAYSRKELSKRDAELATILSAPSPAFLIGTVGSILWGDRSFGILLYLAALLSALLTAMLACRILPTENSPQPPPADENAPPIRASDLAKLFCNAVTASLSAVLTVCAYVVFFSAFSKTFLLTLQNLPLSPFVIALFTSMLELSGGVSMAARLANVGHAALLTAFAVGWCGLSVHFQTLAMCGKIGISLRPYCIAKLAQGILTPPLFCSLLLLFY